MKRALIFLTITVIAALAVIGYDFFHKTTSPFRGFDRPVTLEIDKGASVTRIARLLHRHKVISNYTYFRLYYRLFHSKKHFQSGEYLFDRPLTMAQVIDKLHEGRVILYKITIKEGLTLPETAALLGEQYRIDYGEFLQATGDIRLVKDIDPAARDLEGYLFPDTFHTRKDISAPELVRLLVDKFRNNLTPDMVARARGLGLSIRQAVTLASLIEKETAAREERFTISSVFHNRLKLGMALDCDPTIIYALKRDGRYRDKLGWKDLEYDSPYNTRRYRGLPPGPICSPGIASIQAALNPETTPYLYFVARGGGFHYFSTTLAEHNAAVRKYIILHQKD